MHIYCNNIRYGYLWSIVKQRRKCYTSKYDQNGNKDKNKNDKDNNNILIIIIITIIQYSMFGDALWWALPQQFIAIVVGPRYDANNHLYPQLHFTLSPSLKTINYFLRLLLFTSHHFVLYSVPPWRPTSLLGFCYSLPIISFYTPTHWRPPVIFLGFCYLLSITLFNTQSPHRRH